MRILHLLNYVGVGGSERYIRNLSEILNKQNHEIILLYNEDGGGLKLFNNRKIQLEMKSILDFRAAMQLKDIVEREKIDIVHTHFLRENAIAVTSKLFGMKKPVIYTRHMVTNLTPLQSSINSLYFRGNSKIIAVSKIVKAQLKEQGVGENKITIIPPPIISKIDQVDKIKPDGEFWIISLGRLSAEKGYIFFLDSLEELFSDGKFPNWKVKILGSGELEGEMKRKIDSGILKDRVEMVGFIEEPSKYLAGSDIFVNHSKEEAFGLSTLEAVQFGLPIIIPQSAGIKDYFNEENNSALMYEYGDVKGLANKISELVQDDYLRQTLTTNANNIFMDNFSQENIANRIKEIYMGEK